MYMPFKPLCGCAGVIWLKRTSGPKKPMVLPPSVLLSIACLSRTAVSPPTNPPLQSLFAKRSSVKTTRFALTASRGWSGQPVAVSAIVSQSPLGFPVVENERSVSERVTSNASAKNLPVRGS